MTDDVQAVAEALRQAAADPDSALGDCGPIAWTGKAGDEVTIIEGHVDEIAEVAVAALRARDTSGDTLRDGFERGQRTFVDDEEHGRAGVHFAEIVEGKQ